MTVLSPPTISGDHLLENLQKRFRLSASRGGIDLPKAAEVVRSRFPALQRKLIHEADLANSGRHVLPGTMNQPYFVGDPIDWYTNPVNDNEFVWVLNRMFHWTTLGRALLTTGNKSYGEKIVSEWQDWTKRCQLPRQALEEADATARHELLTGCHPWRLLEAGIRGYQWPEALRYLDAAGMLTAELLSSVVPCLQAHGWYLSTFAPALYPRADHNHYVMEMLGLLAITCTFPELPEAKAWRVLACRELERCIEAQIAEEGGQIEGCPAYHDLCVTLFGRTLGWARENDFELPAAFTKKYRQSVAYALQATRPTGEVVPWGDSDCPPKMVEEAVLSVYRNTGDADPLRIVAGLIGKSAFLERAQQYVWEIDLQDLQTRLEEPPSKLPPLVQWHRSLDQVTARSDWSNEALSLFFACRLPHNGHAHIDLNSFDLTARGKALVIDPGRFTYREDADRYEFKRAASHSTLLVDERDPYAYVATWSFGPQQPARVLAVRQEGDCVVMTGGHSNYRPAIHRRTVVLVGHLCVVVLDEVSGLEPDQTVQIYFHLDSTSLTWNPETKRLVTKDPGPNLLIVAPPAVEGSLLPGRISERLDCERPSTRLRLSDAGGPAARTYLSILVPFGTEVPTVDLPFSPASLPSVIRVQDRTIDLARLCRSESEESLSC